MPTFPAAQASRTHPSAQAGRVAPAAQASRTFPSDSTAPPPYIGTKAGQLDGVDEYLFGPSQTINTVAVAVSCWFYVANTTGEKLLCHQRVSGTSYFSLYVNGATVSSDARRTAAAFTATTGAVVTAGQWHHAVACLDDAGGGTGRVRVWVDGTLQATQTGTITHGTMTSVTAYGRVQQVPLWYLNGKIADIFWWDASLSDADVSAMWNGGDRGDPEALSGLTAPLKNQLT